METKPSATTQERPGRFRRLSAWKQAAVVVGCLLVALLFVAMLLAAYGRGTEMAPAPSTASIPRSVANYGEMATGRAAYEGQADEDAAKAGGASYASLETWGRQLILSAAVSLEVKDVRSAYDAVQLMAAREGALVTGATLKASSGSDDEDDYGHASLILRVPQSRFHAVRQRLLSLAGDLDGRVLSDEVSTEDVTEEYVDLEARLRHWRAQETQLLETMSKAREIKDILAVRNNLAQVQQEIERLAGRLRFLENRVDLAVITLEIHQKGKAPAEPTLIANWKKAGAAIAGAFKKALTDVVLVVGWIGVVVVYLLPFGIVAALIWAAVRAARRRAVARASGT